MVRKLADASDRPTRAVVTSAWEAGTGTQRPPLPLGDEFIEVVGLGRGQLPHDEVVEDEDVGSDEFADPFLQVRSA